MIMKILLWHTRSSKTYETRWTDNVLIHRYRVIHDPNTPKITPISHQSLPISILKNYIREIIQLKFIM